MPALPHQDKMSVTSSYSVQPRHRTVEFGDGYIQRTPLGLQHARRMLTVVHQNLPQDMANELIEYYELRMYRADVVNIDANSMLREAGEFYLQTFDVEMTSPEIRTITASLMEVFDV